MTLEFQLNSSTGQTIVTQHFISKYHQWCQNKNLEKNGVSYTLGAKTFEVGDIWLETRVIIKISPHPRYPRTFDWFSWGWSKFFSKSPILISAPSVFVFWLSLVVFTFKLLLIASISFWKIWTTEKYHLYFLYIPWAFCHPAFLAHVPSICPWRLNHIWERPPRDHRCTRRPHGVPQSRQDPETWTPVVPPAVFD